MIMRTKLIIIFSLCLLGCKKFRDLKEGADASGNERIRGRLFLYDNITKGNEYTPLGSKRITIQYANSADSVNYLYEQTTTTDGYFEFKYLKAGTEYKIIYNEEANGIIYTAFRKDTAPKDTITLIASVDREHQTGFHAVISDSLKGTFSGMEVCVFNSRTLYENNDCSQSFAKISTDTLGRIYLFGIPANTYYFTGIVNIKNRTYQIRDSIVIKDKVVLDTFFLRPKPEDNGIHYTVLDASGSRVPGGDICVFSSLELYRRDTCEGHNFQIPVGNDGTGEQRNIRPDTYYIYYSRLFGDKKYIARDTITVKDQFLTDTLWLK